MVSCLEIRIPGGSLRADEIAALLAELHDHEFGGARAGKYRISRKFLRQLAGRRRLTPQLIDEFGDELFERGFVIVDLETFFAVLHLRLFNSYRRVTSAAIEQVSGTGDDLERAPTRTESTGAVRSANAAHDRMESPQGEREIPAPEAGDRNR